VQRSPCGEHQQLQRTANYSLSSICGRLGAIEDSLIDLQIQWCQDGASCGRLGWGHVLAFWIDGGLSGKLSC
jgi:hypothetical protein